MDSGTNLVIETGNFVNSMSTQYGTGNGFADLLFLFLSFAACAFLVYKRKPIKAQQEDPWAHIDLPNMLCRLEELEVVVREHIRISQQTTEHFKGYVGFLKHEMQGIREIMDGGSAHSRERRNNDWHHSDPNPEIPRGNVIQPKKASFGRR